ncbi:DEAD/DEAH box helicase [Paenibacillus swuensis]|uniref:DEAD/DEAH box helicase n=1 Tax=Paenibacillus swuensis TaxID=1178515 RepID=UPI0008384034|nr:DEAD/DEAH box helicase [Paenibacillus swuensis]
MIFMDGVWSQRAEREGMPYYQLNITISGEGTDNGTREQASTLKRIAEAVPASVCPHLITAEDQSLLQLTPDSKNIEEFLSYLLTLERDYDAELHIGLSKMMSLWIRCAELLLQTLSNGSFLPTVSIYETSKESSVRFEESGNLADPGSSGSSIAYCAVWEVLLDSPELQYRLHHLIESFRDDAALAERMLHDARSFVAVCADLFIRAQADRETAQSALKAMNPRFTVPLTPAEHWMHSLLTDPAPRAEGALEWIAGEVRSWTQAAQRTQEPHAYTTCLRLEEPTAAQDPSAKHAGSWRLSFHLRVKEDDSLLVPAEAVWREAADELVIRSFRFKQPQERLLAQLGAAARVFPPLRASFAQQAPTGCPLSLEEAYSFLQEAAPQLQRLGLAVLVPAWWRSRPRWGVQLRLQTAAASRGDDPPADAVTVAGGRSAAAGVLGFASLMSYRSELAVGEDVISREELRRLIEERPPMVRAGGGWVPFRPELAKRFLDRYGPDGEGQMPFAEAVQLALATDADAHQEQDAHLLASPRVADLPVRSVIAEGEVGRLLSRLRGKEPFPARDQPVGLKGTLRPYQTQGFRWLLSMRDYGMGACLADDMGLGKTIQWIAYMLSLYEHRELQGPCLLIAPTSVLENWRRELERFAPDLKPWLHYGSGRLDADALSVQSQTTPIILTSYATALRDEAVLKSITWDVLTLDEAQNIKNTGSKQTRSIRTLHARHRIALTGTPVENTLNELWSIMQFLNPGYLGPQEEFRSQFAIPIEREGDEGKASALQLRIRPFILRRVKSDESIIRDLPDKLESKEYCPLTREQANLYEAAVQKVLRLAESSEGIQRKGAILAAITHLKQICNHPAHFLRQGEPDPARSGKSLRLLEMLEEVFGRKQRALVFTQYAQMARLLHVMTEEHFGTEVLLMTGDASKKQRDEMIRRFQEDEEAPLLFILSLKTGGFGINLTRANHVFHYDRWWNPAVENQATDRAYRIGQQRNVQVHKFITSGTLEEKIDTLIENKQQLAEHVVGKGEQWLTELSTEQLREMFTLGKELLVEEDETWMKRSRG